MIVKPKFEIVDAHRTKALASNYKTQFPEFTRHIIGSSGQSRQESLVEMLAKLGARVFPCGAICQIEYARSLAWKTFSPFSRHWIHSIAWARNSFGPETHMSKLAFVASLWASHIRSSYHNESRSPSKSSDPIQDHTLGDVCKTQSNGFCKLGP